LLDPKTRRVLQDLGWTPYFEDQLTADDVGTHPARVVSEHGQRSHVQGAFGDDVVLATGRLRRSAGRTPAAGDWLLVADGMVRRILEPRTALSRKVAGQRSDTQVIAANVDHLLLVTSANRDFNERRLERYLVAAGRSGAAPTIVINKADLEPQIGPWLRRACSVAGGAPVYAVSAQQHAGLEPLRRLLAPGVTLALVGSSGVGKSTLVNALLGVDRQAVAEARADDDRGRHTTTHRALFAVPGGGWLLDTPGMRELALPGGDDLGGVFEDIDALARRCRFRDCRHQDEPGCAAQQAVADGTLDPARLDGWSKLKREDEYLQRRRDELQARDQKIRMKRRSKRARVVTLERQRRRGG
jgi:ribosome biogenesis GTPase